jgi:sodium--glutamate symport carrier gltS
MRWGNRLPLLGGTYNAAVIAVTQIFGRSPLPFIALLPVSALFIDLLNAVLIPFSLHRV